MSEEISMLEDRWKAMTRMQVQIDHLTAEVQRLTSLHITGVAFMKQADETILSLTAALATAREGLEWYEEQARNCRKVSSEGNAARYALDKDGGAKAKAILALIPSPPSNNSREEEKG